MRTAAQAGERERDVLVGLMYRELTAVVATLFVFLSGAAVCYEPPPSFQATVCRDVEIPYLCKSRTSSQVTGLVMNDKM
jgi:hypothetical protein